MRLSLNLLGKAPQAGRVKTRLEPMLGSAGAAWAQARLLEHTLALAHTWQQAAPHRLFRLWAEPDITHPFFRAHVTPQNLRPQPPGELGSRLSWACQTALTEADGVLLMGGDAASLTPQLLEQASQCLIHHEAVMVPAEDGGYLLLGLRRCHPSLFQQIPWGTDQVAQITRHRLQALSWSWQELPTLWDVDRPADWSRFCNMKAFPAAARELSPGECALCCPDTPLGPLWLVATVHGITQLSWQPVLTTATATPLLEQAMEWLTNYFAQIYAPLPVPLAPFGTPTQQKIWHHLTTIPPGTTCTYGEVARRVGGGPRSIGQGVKHNPYPILVPCHRVVASHGPGGYSGFGGVETKKILLAGEGVDISVGKFPPPRLRC